MKRIGILGGTTPESTAIYYRYLTREYTRRFGDHAYPEVLIYSVSFQRYVDWMRAGDWEAVADAAAEGLGRLADAGAEFGLMATNTFHRVFDRVAAAVPIPLLSIVDAVAERLTGLGCRRPALLGTRATMSAPFYSERLAALGMRTTVPDTEEQEAIDRTIFDELSRGDLRPASKEAILTIARRLIREEEADAVILGCTELPLLVEADDLPVPVLDTAVLHADAALEEALR